MITLNGVPRTHNKLHKTIMSIIAASKFQLTIAFRIVSGKQNKQPSIPIHIIRYASHYYLQKTSSQNKTNPFSMQHLSSINQEKNQTSKTNSSK